jgi:hypothetical protein
MPAKARQAGHGEYRHALDKRGLSGVRDRHEGAALPARPGQRNHRQDATHGTDIAGQRDLSNEDRILDVGHDVATRDHEPDRDGQVVGRPLFSRVGRRKIDGDPAVHRPTEAAVADGRAHALLRFLNGGIGQPDHGYLGMPAADVHLDIDEFAIEADDGAAEDASEHGGRVKRKGRRGKRLEAESGNREAKSGNVKGEAAAPRNRPVSATVRNRARQ